jgi:hypothetical protein
MLLLVSAAPNLASNVDASSLDVFAAGALLTIGRVLELPPSPCCACAHGDNRLAAAMTSTAVVDECEHCVGNRLRFWRIAEPLF